MAEEETTWNDGCVLPILFLHRAVCVLRLSLIPVADVTFETNLDNVEIYLSPVLLESSDGELRIILGIMTRFSQVTTLSHDSR